MLHVPITHSLELMHLKFHESASHVFLCNLTGISNVYTHFSGGQLNLSEEISGLSDFMCRIPQIYLSLAR